MPPLVVDLDGTLIRTDMLHESALAALRTRPLDLLRVPGWLYQGKAVVKQHLAEPLRFDPTVLPYNEELVDWLTVQHDAGRPLVLCTASDQAIATTIAEHVGLFDEVIASDGKHNLAGDRKARALEERFGAGGFDYAGNSTADLDVWACARRGLIVNARPDVAARARASVEVEREFPRRPLTLNVWRRTLRLHQWLKNVLLFVPVLAAHALDFTLLPTLLIACLAFSLCASAVYITNDLLDLENDRVHPRKRSRPFASGVIPIRAGVILAPLLLAASLVLGELAGREFLTWLLVYFVLTCAYSFGLKRLLLVDCIVLAMLYTLRVVAGAAAAHLSLSFWLLAFSTFLFLSLAFVKRYAELEAIVLAGERTTAHGRGYETADAPLIQALGIGAGFAAVLVMALYLNSDAIVRLYRAPQVIWGAIPVMLFWISWMWMQAHRGRMHDDPLVFAVKDPTSLAAGALFAAVLVLGAAGVG